MYSTDFLKIRPPALTDTEHTSNPNGEVRGKLLPSLPARRGTKGNRGNGKIGAGPEFSSSGKQFEQHLFKLQNHLSFKLQKNNW